MPRKLKFKPVIRRVKLNPEQAVLACACYCTFQSSGGYNNQWGIVCGGRSFFTRFSCVGGSSTSS